MLSATIAIFSEQKTICRNEKLNTEACNITEFSLGFSIENIFYVSQFTDGVEIEMKIAIFSVSIPFDTDN